MKKILFLLFFGWFAHVASSQTYVVIDPQNFTEELNPNNSNFQFMSRINGVWRRGSFDNIKDAMQIMVQPTPITYTPSATGNSLNLGQIVKTASNEIWFIDAAGRAMQINSGGGGGSGADWNTNLTNIPAGFSDGIDNVDDADNSPTNEIPMYIIRNDSIFLSYGNGDQVFAGFATRKDEMLVDTFYKKNDSTICVVYLSGDTTCISDRGTGGGGGSETPQKYYAGGFGQSNMEGQYPESTDKTPNERLRLANLDGTTEMWNPSTNNPAFQFGKNWIRENTNDTLVFFFVNQSGTSISEWYNNSGSLRSTFESQYSAHGSPVMDFVTWMQGEADSYGNSNGINLNLSNVEADSNYYNTFIDSVYLSFLNEFTGFQNTKWVLGTPLAKPGADNEGLTIGGAIRWLGYDKYENVGYCEGFDLTSPDNLHFSGLANDTLGLRFYNSYKNLPYRYTKSILPEISILADSNYLNFTADFDAENYTFGDTVFSNWSSHLIVDSIAGVQSFIRNAYTPTDSTIISAARSVEIPNTRFENQVVRWKSYTPTGGGSNIGVVLGTHRTATGNERGNGWFIRQKEPGIEIFQLEDGVTTSRKSNVTDFWGNDKIETIQAELIGDSLINVYKVQNDNSLTSFISYEIPLANRFSVTGGVSLWTHPTQTDGEFIDVKVWEKSKNPYPLKSDDKFYFVNRENIEFEQLEPGVITAKNTGNFGNIKIRSGTTTGGDYISFNDSIKIERGVSVGEGESMRFTSGLAPFVSLTSLTSEGAFFDFSFSNEMPLVGSVSDGAFGYDSSEGVFKFKQNGSYYTLTNQTIDSVTLESSVDTLFTKTWLLGSVIHTDTATTDRVRLFAAWNANTTPQTLTTTNTWYEIDNQGAISYNGVGGITATITGGKIGFNYSGKSRVLQYQCSATISSDTADKAIKVGFKKNAAAVTADSRQDHFLDIANANYNITWAFDYLVVDSDRIVPVISSPSTGLPIDVTVYNLQCKVND